QFASEHLNRTAHSCKRIADLVSYSGSHFAQCGEAVAAADLTFEFYDLGQILKRKDQPGHLVGFAVERRSRNSEMSLLSGSRNADAGKTDPARQFRHLGTERDMLRLIAEDIDEILLDHLSGFVLSQLFGCAVERKDLAVDVGSHKTAVNAFDNPLVESLKVGEVLCCTRKLNVARSQTLGNLASKYAYDEH